MYNTRAWVQGKSWCCENAPEISLIFTTKAADVKAALTCTSCCPSTFPLLQLHHLHNYKGTKSARTSDIETSSLTGLSQAWTTPSHLCVYDAPSVLQTMLTCSM